MKKILFVAVLACAAFACKKKNADNAATGSGSAAATPTATGGATCAQAIDNSMTISKADMEKMPGYTAELGEKMRVLGVSRCESDKWSPEAIKCMADAKTTADAQGCYDKLTQEQRDAMNKAAMELVAPPAGSDSGSAGSGSADSGSGAGSADGSAAAGTGSN